MHRGMLSSRVAESKTQGGKRLITLVKQENDESKRFSIIDKSCLISIRDKLLLSFLLSSDIFVCFNLKRKIIKPSIYNNDTGALGSFSFIDHYLNEQSWHHAMCDAVCVSPLQFRETAVIFEKLGKFQY